MPLRKLRDHPQGGKKLQLRRRTASGAAGAILLAGLTAACGGPAAPPTQPGPVAVISCPRCEEENVPLTLVPSLPEDSPSDPTFVMRGHQLLTSINEIVEGELSVWHGETCRILDTRTKVMTAYNLDTEAAMPIEVEFVLVDCGVRDGSPQRIGWIVSDHLD